MPRRPHTKGEVTQIELFTKQHRRSLKALAASDGLSAPDFLRLYPPAHQGITVTYRCFNRHTIELPLSTGSAVCERCGSKMRPQL